MSDSGFPLWRRQVLTILVIEARKRFLGRRALVLYGLAMIPVFAMAMYAAVVTAGTESELSSAAVYAATYRAAVLRFVVFFGCVAVFSSLFRGEMIERTLHYYFLAPVRRPVLVVGKYLSGLLATVILFGGSTAASWAFAHVRAGGVLSIEGLLTAERLSQLASYLLVTTLACIGYGAVFLAIGLAFRSPILPAIAILAWEQINALLPPLLKKVSVIHYLESLCPVPLPADKVSILADPSPAWISIPGLLLLATALLVISSILGRRMEVLYGTD